MQVQINQSTSEFVRHQAEAFRSLNANHSKKSLDKGVWYPTEYFDALEKANQKPRMDWLKQKNFCHLGYAPPKFFTRVEGYTFTFKAKPEVSASDALDELVKGLSLLECGTALQLTLWRSLRDTIGVERFNLFLSEPDYFLYLQQGAYILSVLYPEVKIRGKKDVQEGDICYFKNITKYPLKHPFGVACGYNTVCVANKILGGNESKFMGFGLSEEGDSVSEIETHLYNEYNKEPLEPQKYLPESEALKKGKPSIRGLLSKEEFEREPSEDRNGMDGRLVLKVRRPRLDRIEELKNAPLSDILKLKAKWNNAL